MRQNLASERGTVLIQVALALLVLIAVNAFVIDYGIMWVGRRAAQNAADAGALAGAVALAFDDFNDRTDTGPAKSAAHDLSQRNAVWGEAPDVDIATDVTFPEDPLPECTPDEGTGLSPCVRVDAYRTNDRGNPLPMLFGAAINRGTQGVRATATARVSVGNASDCLKPFAVPDKWIDYHDVDAPIETDPPQWTPEDKFEVDTGGGNPTPLPNPDVYIPPNGSDPGSGFTIENDYGTVMVIKSPQGNQGIQPGWYYPVVLPVDGMPANGASLYQWNIANCNGNVIGIGSELEVEPGAMVGPTNAGIQALIDQDPNAHWDPDTRTVEGSCAQQNPPCAARSPRIVAIPLFDINTLEASGRTTVRVVNILGFFIEGISANEVTGRIVNVPGLRSGSYGNITSSASFLRFISLVR